MNSAVGNKDEQRNLESSGGFQFIYQQHKNQSSFFSGKILRIVLVFSAIALLGFVFLRAYDPLQPFPATSYTFVNNSSKSTSEAEFPASPSWSQNSTADQKNLSSPTCPDHDDSGKGNLSSSSAKIEEDEKLRSVLERAAIDNKTVIITTLNAAWTSPNSIFDLFLEGFRIGNQTLSLLDHVVVAALDKTAYARCSQVHKHCYALLTEGIDFSGEAFYMSEDYLKMMWRRIDFLRVVLHMGFDFIFTDADILWFRNPFPHFYDDADFQIACDRIWYNSDDLNNQPNGGFTYVKSNNRSIAFYKFWYDSRENFTGKHDQDVLNMIKFDPYIAEIGIKIRFLHTAYYGGFCEPSKDLNLVCTMHANCCIGIENKIHDLKMLVDDWKKYMSLMNSPNGTSTPMTWTVPRICG